ncbi:MAG: nicotinate-nucleotide--dimethylbenzimidazole phosphoribosyltransferase, partial [Dermatophilaceae bacterium]
LEPVLDLRIRAGEGVGAALAVGLIQDARSLRRKVARTEGYPQVPSSTSQAP